MENWVPKSSDNLQRKGSQQQLPKKDVFKYHSPRIIPETLSRIQDLNGTILTREIKKYDTKAV